MENIFINYRREDSIETSGRIYDRLVIAFGKEAIFKDVDNIPPGIDFPSYIQRFVRRSSVMLVIIGRQWATITDSQGIRRLDKPNDFVRIEIEGALEGRIPIIPVLVQHASMPSSDRFPTSIQKVAYLNSTDVRYDPDFNKDMEQLIRAISQILNPTPPTELTLSAAIEKSGYGAVQLDVAIHENFWRRLIGVGIAYEGTIAGKEVGFGTLSEAEQFIKSHLKGKYDEHGWIPLDRPESSTDYACS